jgi:cell division protein FtsB
MKTRRGHSSVPDNDLEHLPMPRTNRRWLGQLLGFATVALILNALIGERGLVERRRVERQAATITAELSTIRRENAELRRRITRLTNDPLAIEHVARAELGLIRRGEVLVLVKDVRTR